MPVAACATVFLVLRLQRLPEADDRLRNLRPLICAQAPRTAFRARATEAGFPPRSRGWIFSALRASKRASSACRLIEPGFSR
jgi:hypothetical protein